MRIYTRLILFLVSVVVSVMAVYAIVTISRTRDRMDAEIMKMADHLGMALSAGVLHHLEVGDKAGVAQVLETMERYRDVVSTAVFDTKGNPVAVSGIPLASVDTGTGVGNQSSGGLLHAHSQQIVDANGNVIGNLRLVITGQSLLGHVVEARNYILFTILVLTVVISASIVYFSRRYLDGPLARLTAGAQAIGYGELTRRITVTDEGEMAVLARSFNQMAASLQNMTAQIVGEREYIRSVVDSIPEGIAVIDCDGRVTAWNRTMADRYGLEAHTVQGQPFDTVMPGMAASHCLDDLHAVLAGQVAAAESLSVRLPQDPERVLTVTASPLRRHEDTVEGAVLVFADVTERLRLQDQVRRSDKLAAVGQLAAGIAHEIGTPLNVISGSAEYLRMDHEEMEELLTIVDEVKRISELVQRLMSFARQDEPHVEAVEVSSVVASVLSLMQHQMQRKGVRVEVDIAADLPVLAADRGQLQQVLVNLVMNAWQAMPTGGELKLSAKSQVLTQNMPTRSCSCPSVAVVIQVADTGQGIAPEQLPRIFEPFYTTKDVGEGTGLGLAIVQRIIEDHDGRVEVRSELGQGTVVELRLPTCADCGPQAPAHV